MDTDLPDIGEVKVGLEPPSIYIFRPDHWLRPSDWEEYRCPASPSPWGDAYFVEYSCGRSLSERAAGWDFVRTLWVRWTGREGDR